MTSLLKVAMASSLLLALAGTTASADVVKGQKLFSKKLKKACGMTGAVFAAKHSQDEWKSIKEAGNFGKEIINICPSVKEGKIKEKWETHIYDFVFEYANDSGNVPSC